MAKRNKLRNTRPKALFGIGETGALIALTAAEVAGHAGQAAAQYASAKTQGDAMLKQAQMQADALQRQNENNNQLQTQMMQFTKEQNDESRRIMKDMQMNLQLQAGGQSMRDRREASKTVLKNGGRKRRKLRNAAYPLQGGNIPFQVTDGGGVIPIGQTPEGYDVYELYGNDHNHYHKAQGGKHKTGVGIKFADGVEIEGEGNQRSNNGELMVTMPNDAVFLSKHSVAGFNPVKSVKQGMDPIEAYMIQENIKDMYGLNDDGSNTPPVEKRLQSAGKLNFRNKAKQGVKEKIASLNNRRKASLGSWLKSGSWAVAPTISGVGNILGAGLSSLGIGLGSNYLSKRIGQAGDLLANAYDQLQGVDMNSVFGDNAKASFSIGHYMPALRSSYFNANPQLEQVSRDVRRQTRAVNNNTLSSAARLSRTNLANVAADDARSKIYADKANREEQIKQANNEAINQAAANNAQLDIEMNKNYTATRADLAKFNANVANERILGKYEVMADARTQQGAIGAQVRQAVMNALGNAATQTGLGYANAYNSKLAQENNLRLARLSATPTGELAYLSDPNTPIVEAQTKINQWRAAANAATDQDAKDYFNGLADQLEAARFNKKSNKPNWLGKVNDIIDSLNNIRYLNYNF